MDREIIWAPPEWAFNCFPLPAPHHELLTLEWVVATLQAHLDTVTEGDTTALGRALHVGHMLTTIQSDEGSWPAEINARTGAWIGEARSTAPLPLFERMGGMLATTEFDHVLRRATHGE